MQMRDSNHKIEVLFICSNWNEAQAPYRRLKYFIEYLRSKGLSASCGGFIQFTVYGFKKLPRGCYPLSVAFSSRFTLLNLVINTILSFFAIILIIMLRPKIIVVSVPDVYTVLPCYVAASLVDAKFIVDVRDPQEIIMVQHYGKGLSSLIAKIYRKVDYHIYKKADIIIGVTRTLIVTLARELGRTIYLSPNGADLTIFKPLDKEEARLKLGLSQESLLIGYVGGLSSYGYYNILPILTSIRKARRELGIDIKLVVAGSIYDEGIKRIVEGFRDESVYLGVLDTKGVITLLSACDLGVIPRIGDPIYDYAIPVKFYEYIATGLPVLAIVSRGSELARIVEKHRLGFVCEPGDRECLESVITTFAINKAVLDEYKKNVIVFRKHVDRKIGAKRLYELISKFLR
jgi:hypothetical protein